MARTRSFIGGTIFSYIFQAAMMLVGLWLTPFNLRMLGQQGYGVWLVGLQVLTFLVLIDFGVVAILPRDVARLVGKAKLEPNSQDLSVLIGKTARIVLWQAIVVGACSAAFYIWWPGISPQIRGPLGITLAAFTLSYPFRIYPAILEGVQDLGFLSRIRMLSWALSVAVSVGLLMLGWRLYALAAGWSVNIFAIQFMALWRLQSRWPEMAGVGHWKSGGKLGWRDFARGSWISVGQVADAFMAGADVLAIAKLMGPSRVVEYNCTGKLTGILSNQPQMIVANALPGLSEMKARETAARVLTVSSSLGTAMLFLTGGVVSVTCAVNEPFVKIWVGPQFFGGVLLTALFLLDMVLRHFDLILSQALFAFGYERLLAIKCLVDSILSAAVVFVCVHSFGLAGAMLGFVIGVLFVRLPVDILLFKREFKVPVSQILGPYWAYLWRMALIGTAGIFAAHHFLPKTYFGTFLLGSVAGIAYLALTVPHMLRTPLGSYCRTLWNDVLVVLKTRMGWQSALK